MSAVYKTRGFVLKRENRSESDRAFTIFTKDFGKIDVFGKAIRKIQSKLRGGIDIFYVSEIEFIEGRHYKTLTEAIAVEKPNYASLAKIEVYHKISLLLLDYIKGQEKDSSIFGELEKIVDIFSNGKIKNNDLIYQYFFWNFLESQGYGLGVSHCVACQNKLNPQEVYFSVKEGGVMCNSCSVKYKDVVRINADVVKVLRIILQKKLDIVARLNMSTNSQRMLGVMSQLAGQSFSPANF